MDLGTIIGLFLISVLLFGSMILGAGIQVYIDIPSLMITVGGSLSALLISFKIEQMKNIFKYIGIAFKPHQYNIPVLIKTIVEYAIKARRDGILSLEQNVNQEENDFLRKGLSMAVDGSEPDAIRELLEIDMEQSLNRHNGNADIFDTWSALAGSFGMLGTLIGLVAMLVNMSDPSTIGPAMAVALITTFYGSLIGNTVGAPVANILRIRAQDEALMKLLVIEGIISIQAGDNPRVLETKLLSFLPPSKRVSQFD
ncbi:motility protein A [Helicobacter sp. MIT 14-3879]|uniref:motility protein A n=1 Tax=Helicobacter sp. MIT 14-3879 TaxID=2040649 RepID=UPI000E1E4094|nr:motility protein A [Helicobacter sp. MIT 14-3879]RDU61705.1 motility protein A [Helicobacter sp. MIT 14-3879]